MGAPDPAPPRLITPSGTLLVDRSLLGRLEQLGEVVEVPFAPPGVAGVAEVRGRVVTLLDLALWLPRQPGGSAVARAGGLPSSAMALAPPFDHLALLIPAGSTLKVAADAGGKADGPVLDPPSLERLLDALGRVEVTA